jgi:hypothetical protein
MKIIETKYIADDIAYEIIEHENVRYHRLFINGWYTVNNNGNIVGIASNKNLENIYNNFIRTQKLKNILNENF